jgi:hypothetical protein
MFFYDDDLHTESNIDLYPIDEGRVWLALLTALFL